MAEAKKKVTKKKATKKKVAKRKVASVDRPIWRPLPPRKLK